MTDALAGSADREARRAAIVAEYRSTANALLPCSRQRALMDEVWPLIVPGTSETGPSLMGWRGGSADAMPPNVLRAVSRAIPVPASAEAAQDELRHWNHRADVHAILDGSSLPIWVEARRAFLEQRFGSDLAQPPQPPGPIAPQQRADAGIGSAEATTTDPGVQSGQAPNRSREEARAAVRELLGEGLPDREIARRVGVSPSTVAAVKKAMRSEGVAMAETA